MTEDEIATENAAIAKDYKELLKISYRTLSAKDKKLIRKAFEVALDAHSTNAVNLEKPIFFIQLQLQK